MLRLFGLTAILVVTPVGLNAQETGNDALLLECREMEKNARRLDSL